jgi:hypothetical protein
LARQRLFRGNTPISSKTLTQGVMTFASTEVSTGVLDIEIQADSVDTGSGMKNGKLKGKDFFDVKNNPLITFKSTKLVQTGPDAFEVDGNFTIRGVSKAEKLTLTVTGAGAGSGAIQGTMAFDRKQHDSDNGETVFSQVNSCGQRVTDGSHPAESENSWCGLSKRRTRGFLAGLRRTALPAPSESASRGRSTGTITPAHYRISRAHLVSPANSLHTQRRCGWR